MSKSSYRTILQSSSIIGGSQVVNIAVGIVKMKIVAVLLGPAGVGFVGLFVNLIQTASAVAALGLGNAGTRQIAAAKEEGGDTAVGLTRRALFWGTLGLAIIGALLFWLASGWIARVILADESRATEVAWLSLGVALTVAAGSQAALLTGLRKIGDRARINVGAAIISATFGVLALWLWGAKGLVAMVLAVPAATFVLGHIYVARLGPPSGPSAGLQELSREWRALVTFGSVLMLSGLVGTLAHLATRTLVQRELGADALGQFQAAWTIGMMYLSVVLNAMSADYYPRLVAKIKDHSAAIRLVNEQTEVALLLCGPVLLALLGLAPWVILLLYTAEFESAVGILRWQLLGDILKVMSWPLGFVLLSIGASKTFVAAESIGMGVFVLGVFLLLPLIGVIAPGVAFLALYIVYLPMVWWLAKRLIGFSWTRAVKMQALMVMGAAVVVDIAARWSDILGAVLGLTFAAAIGCWAVMRLSAMTEAGGQLGQIAAIGERIKGWMIKRL